MISFFGKKKLSTEKISKQFIANLLDATEKGFEQLAELINDDPAFVKKPNINPAHYQPFMLIVLAANFKLLPSIFDVTIDSQIKQHSFAYLNEVFEEDIDFEQKIKEIQSMMARLNHPSKNILYAMPKAVFALYELNAYQQDYFKNLNNPDPTFLKRIQDLMPHFIWNWDDILKNYKIV